MSFQSLGFLVFLAAAVCGCRLWGNAVAPRSAAAAGNTAALPLALFSLFFYWRGCNALPELLPVAASLLVTWLSARCLQSGRGHRQMVFIFAVCWHTAVLLIYKYTAFFTGGRLSVAPAPLGLSFFTFQQIWLLKEVYTGSFSLMRGMGTGYLSYAFFFPTVASGPILKPRDFFPQLRGNLRAGDGDFAAGLYAISRGMAQKVLLADPLGVVVSNGWGLGDSLTAPAAWVVILGYTLQLYLDFSGYCDIASGCARLLGIRLPMNFDTPYRALSVGEFWKRWHITLTNFLRECVYIPLGGSRRGTARTCLHILIVYLISGFWHGAGWTFLVWGGLHGLAQIAERLAGSRRERLPKPLRWTMTFLFVNLAWVFFQAPSLTAAGTLLRAAFRGGWELPLEALATGVLDSEVTALRTLLPFATKALPGLVLAALLGVSLAVSLRRRSVFRRMEDVPPAFGGAVVCGLFLAWAILSFSSTATFIYSNF